MSSTETIPACPLALTPADLAAWRDGALAPDEARRIEAHLASCSGCRARLAEYETIAMSLRAIRVPDPIEGFGHNPRFQPQRNGRRRAGLPHVRLIGGMGALAAALLVTLAFAQVFNNFGRHATALRTPIPSVTPSSTPTALPAIQLAWRPATFPPGFSYNAGYPNLSIAPTDGQVAYACVLIASGHGLAAQIWQTHDRAAHWTQVFTGPVEQADANTCTVYADGLDPQVAVVSAAWAFRTAPPSSNQSTSYATFDGGSTWRQLAGHTLVTQPATVGSATYAIVRTQPGVGMGELVQTDLAVSRDQMKTWTPIDQAIIAAKYTFQFVGQDPALRSFWLNRPLGELLAEAADPDQGNRHLWSSMDGGQHWRELAPEWSGNGFVVQVGDRGPSWSMCTLGTDPAITGQTSALVCSTDGGQTWSERPLLMLPFDNQGGKSLGPTTAPAYPNAIADDGAIFATAASAQLPDSTFVGCTLYRLVPGATEWQSLGPAPAFQAYYASAPANGLLWEIRSDTTSASTDRLYTPFTAAYP